MTNTNTRRTMNHQTSPLRRTILATGAVIATGVLFAAPAIAAPTITFTGRVLTITGDAANNGLVVGQNKAGLVTLNGSAVLGGTVPVAGVQVVLMTGGAGDDNLRLDETNGPMPRAEFDGGAGRDAVVGGSQADKLTGGNGIDRAVGGPGDDDVSLGDGADQFTWNPGDGNDHVDGNTGTDTLIFNGSDRAPEEGQRFETEELNFRSDGSRTTIRRALTRQLPLPSEIDVMSLSGFEDVKTPLAGGPNSVNFSDSFSGSDINVVRVDLGPPGTAPFDPSQAHDTRSRAGFVGTEGADRIRISGTPAAGVTVTGVGPTVVLAGTQLLDVTADPGNGGADDLIDASRLTAGTVEVLREDGRAGNDSLIGHPGRDELFGGLGDDRLEGRGGADDILDGGTGNNVIIP